MKKLLSWLSIPCTALAVLSGSIACVLLVRPFYYVQIGPLGLCAASGLTEDRIRQVYGEIMDYCLGLRPDFSAGGLPAAENKAPPPGRTDPGLLGRLCPGRRHIGRGRLVRHGL